MRPYHFDYEQTQARRAKPIAIARPVAWHRPSPPRRRNPSSYPWDAALALLTAWLKRVRERRELAARDIGVTSSEVAYEANMPFWKA